MILADTSVWIDFFRRGSPFFARKLTDAKVLIHPIVLGELASGNLRARPKTLAMLFALPQIRSGAFEDCFRFLETHRLHGVGMGWEDIQLLYSCHHFRIELWTFDKALAAAARDIGIAGRCTRS